jgi:hypothetical protein
MLYFSKVEVLYYTTNTHAFRFSPLLSVSELFRNTIDATRRLRYTVRFSKEKLSMSTNRETMELPFPALNMSLRVDVLCVWSLDALACLLACLLVKTRGLYHSFY